ncbi:MAG: TolC family protein [Vulcanimicrobiaceae bacterium]
MNQIRFSRAAAAGALIVAALAIVLGAGAGAQTNPPVRLIAPSNAPTPYPLPTFGPVSQPTSLPYPAYGTPAPGVGAGPSVPGVNNVLTLQQAIDVGLARAPQLAISLSNVRVDQAAVGLSKTAIFPNISANASTERGRGQTTGSLTNGTTTGGTVPVTTRGSGSSFTTNGLTINLRQLIFDGGKIAAQLRQAKATEVAALDTYRRQGQTIAFDVATAYYNSLAAQRQTQVDLETVKLDQVQENLVNAQFHAGTASKVDVATAQLPVAQARVAVVRDQGAELNAQAAFANAMGLPADANVLPADDTPVFDESAFASLTIPTYQAAVARAIASRPDYDAAVNTIRADEAAYKAARLGTFPVLNGVADYGVSSSDASGGSFRNSNGIGLQLSIPIYDQGITAAQRAQAQAITDGAKAQLAFTEQSIQLAVKQALVGLVSARAQLDEVQIQYTEASQVLQATEAQYRAGVTTLPLLLNAQVSFTSALTARVTAVYNLRQAQQAFAFATGASL